VDVIDYGVNAAQAEAFYASIRRYWAELPDGALQPDYTGVQPKLYRRREAARDFYIQCADEHGVPGLTNLNGIESPGLTSSLAIGDHVAGLSAVPG
jgi:L-2-hydroxyglutarate oxidase LhgO